MNNDELQILGAEKPRKKNKVEIDVSNTVYSYGIAHFFGKQGEK